MGIPHYSIQHIPANKNEKKNELLMAIVDQNNFNVKSDVLMSYRRKRDLKNMTRAKAAKME
jgi:hypothetical protein